MNEKQKQIDELEVYIEDITILATNIRYKYCS
jgi:hypothetical protein